MNGGLIFGYLHLVLLKIGLHIYRVLTFILMFSSGIFVHKILKGILMSTKNQSFF